MIVHPTCCSRQRRLPPWGYAETWCGQTLEWYHRWPRWGNPSPELHQTWQRWRAWLTKKWLQQIPGLQGYHRPPRETTKRRSQVWKRLTGNLLFFTNVKLTTTTSSLRNPRTFPEAYCMENPVPFSIWVRDLEPSYLLCVTKSSKE